MSPQRKLAARFERIVHGAANITVPVDDFTIVDDHGLRQRILDNLYKLQTAAEQLAHDMNIMVLKGEMNNG